MKSSRNSLFLSAVLLLAALAIPALLISAQPLSKDDITLLLIGGASEQKMVALVEQRGVDFQLTPDLIKKFRSEGATDNLINAIVKANRNQASKPAPAGTSQSGPLPRAEINSGPGPDLPGPQPKVTTLPSAPANAPAPAPASGPSQQGGGAAAGNGTGTAKAAAAPPGLSDPSPSQIQQIIQTFAAKETQFKLVRDNYTYHQINRVEALDADGKVTGRWEQDWDILFDNQGKRVEHVTFAPASTLKTLILTEQDLDSFRNVQPFVLTTSELPEYQIKYLGHVKVDYITAYVFSVRPVKIKKGHQYFKGVVWVDDRDLQIVKSEGETVPQVKGKHGQENLMPRFTTWRQQIDGKYWFPTFTMADDTLYFANGPVHVREIVRYTDYKQFKSTTRIISVSPEKFTDIYLEPER